MVGSGASPTMRGGEGFGVVLEGPEPAGGWIL